MLRGSALSPCLAGTNWSKGDKIYIFGFSRGAFTARFLSRMVHTVGLLCKGNEEMVPFAYRLYQRYRRGEIQLCKDGKKRRKATDDKGGSKDSDEDGEDTEVNDDDDDDDEHDDERHWHWPHRRRRHKTGKNEITAFSDTFCRKEQVHHQGWVEERNIKVYFLGIWDCVNSVSVMESRTPLPVPITGTAHYVRHAVAVDERRVKFKPALLAQDIRAAAQSHIHEDIKEVWFPGCHGDIGGGWPAADLDTHGEPKDLSIWQRIKGFWTTNRAKQASKNVLTDPFQMSDIPLAWMIREVELVGKKDPAAAVKWRPNAAGFKERFRKRKDQALKAVMHDTLQFNRGTGFFTVLLWRFMGECLDPPRIQPSSLLTPFNRMVPLHNEMGTREKRMGKRPLPAKRRRHTRYTPRRRPALIASLETAQRPGLQTTE